GRPPLCVPAARAVHYWNQAPQPAQGKLQLMMESEARYRAKFYSQPLPLPALEQRYAPPSEDLGEHRDSPRFDLPAGTARLDFAMDPAFTLFIQTAPPEPLFRFPAPVWAQLQDGDYHGRARDRAGRFLRQWHWRKRSS